MKKIITIILSILALNGYSQDYMDKIAKQTCECLTKISDTTNTDRMYIELGLCMMTASEPYKKQLKKDHGIDFNSVDQEAGQALGKVVGIRMASICPNELIKLSERDKKEEDAKAEESLLFVGRISKIDRENFVTFSATDNSGKLLKFYWFTFVESNIELINNYKTLIETDVRIKYQTQEFFDPKIGEYRNFNIIEKIEKISK